MNVVDKMWIDAFEITENCPKEIKEEIDELAYMGMEFLDKIEILPNQYFDEVRVEVEEANSELMAMIGKFLSIVSVSYKIPEGTLELGYKFKFEESMKEILNELRNPSKLMTNYTIVSTYLSSAGNLKTIYLYLIHYPIVTANKQNIKKLEEYFKEVFKMVMDNANILGKDIKPVAMRDSRKIFGSPSSMILNLTKPKKEPPTSTENSKEESGVDLEEDYEFSLIENLDEDKDENN